ncbi:MAG TPA: spore gernimation protein [Bacillus bacterium]|nr:spore gernimation protein [Bacillus sp. (in: firmicutes)]
MGIYPLRYLALGDSLTVGIGVPAFDSGFVEYYWCLSQQTLKRHIQYKKYAKSGATTADVLTMLSSPVVTEAVRNANIITITAGGDDLINAAKRFIKDNNEEILSYAIEQSRKNFSKLLERIHNIEKQDQYIIRLTNLYNPFPHIPIADEGVKTFNSSIASFAEQKNVKVADIYSVFKGNEQVLLSRGGVHPNSEGYYQMALAFYRLGYFQLAPL